VFFVFFFFAVIWLSQFVENNIASSLPALLQRQCNQSSVPAFYCYIGMT